MHIPVQKKAILITGASTGIGKVCALYLSRAGYKVFAGIRTETAGETLIQESSNAIMPVFLDITKPEMIRLAVERISRSIGNDTVLWGLVNNAGVAIGGPLEYLPMDEFRNQIEVNLIGHIAVIQSFLPFIRKAKGKIINMGSVCGCFALPFSSAYSASKFAIEGATDALRRELMPWKIDVSLIELGAIATPIHEKIFDKAHKLQAELLNAEKNLYQNYTDSLEKVFKIGSDHAISPLVVAKLVKKILETKRAKPRYIVGKDAGLGYLSRFFPARWNDWIIFNILQNRLPSIFMGW